ncbi:hypothetical protein C4588_06165 [Candidatus Parcubacteria bacterium]|nr:MAG: hypothetical protein C4588_06165 [Candidatus Parcubacteria bacterium]
MEALKLEVLQTGFCGDCQKEVEIRLYNDKVIPKIFTCVECGQFVEERSPAIGKALAMFDFKEAVFADIESFKTLEIVDTKTEGDVRKARMSVRDLRYKIQNNQKEINADLNQKKKDVKEYAELLISRIEPVENDLDGKIKAVEQAREEKRIEKERIEVAKKAEIERAEFLRKGKIQWYMDGLEADCTAGLEYNLPAQEIIDHLVILDDIEISKDDFQERSHEAQAMLNNCMSQTRAAYGARLKYEQDQEEQAKIRVEQEAEAKKLAYDRAKFEAEQAAARAEADKKANEEAARIKAANEKLVADREAIRKQEAEIEARNKADIERKYYSDWTDAIEINRIMIPDLAIQMNQKFDEALKEKLRADAERAKLISADIEKLNQAHDHVFLCWSKMVPVKKFDTHEGEAAFNHFKNSLGDLLSHFQTVIAEIA